MTGSRRCLSRKASGEDFLKAWKWDELERLPHPHGRRAADDHGVDQRRPDLRGSTRRRCPIRISAAAAVLRRLGNAGHIAFEVHDNDPRMGEERWAPNAACRWRNIRVTPL